MKHFEGGSSPSPKHSRDDVTADVVARIVKLVHRPPNIRNEPLAGDLKGDFDHWFDGGAVKVFTGWIEYTFTDGSRAHTAVTPMFNVTIDLPDGRQIEVREREEAKRIPF
jgi:hypothetical protein